jgi:glucose/arabinose dehydrogenase
LTSPSDSADRLFVVEQKGRILSFENTPSVSKATLFLDIRSRVRTKDPEEGLLCMALHPSFSTNGLFYVYYIASDPHREVLSEFKVSSRDPNKADPTSERVLLSIPKKYGNHNGACLLFGPEGYLYCGLGDGGAGGDPDNNAQNLSSLWGKMLRIDVDHRDPGKSYAIPKDNPFVGKTGTRGEVWAYGLRNPWRMSFDRKTSELWVGDVGQDKWEEIDIVQRGGNYGWSVMEGKHEYNPSRKTQVPLTGPVLDYPHNPKDADPPAAFSGPCITGGYVYRGKRLKGFEGVYFYADYVLGWVRALHLQNGKVDMDEAVIEQPENISSFGEDANGELYLLGYSNGRVYRFEP